MTSDNPLLADWAATPGVPPFAAIRAEHFEPAFEAAIVEHQSEVDAIARNDAPATFENTIDALEIAGHRLRQVGSVFFNLTGAHTNDALEAIERTVAPRLSRHRNAIALDDDLFRRIDDLMRRRETLGLSAEQARVLERYHLSFSRSGAGRPQAVRDRLSAIGERLATLGTQFGQNVLADERSWTLELDGEADLAGLPAFVRDAAARAGADRGLEGKSIITLSRSSIEPFLQFSTRRDLREAAFRAWIARGETGATDNHAIIAETVSLRAERATLLGYPSFAHFRLADSMAKTPEAANGLLRSVWEPARLRASVEQAALQALASEEGGNFTIAPWDWRYYSERRRKLEFDLDESEVKPYLQLDRMIEAAFDTATRLFGVTFEERRDIETYHPDVRVFDVKDASGEPVALFLGDYFARPSKRSGAWMSSFRSQERLAAEVRPIVVNVMNFSKGGEGQPSLLSFDDARTLFHEFGHGLHGMLSDVVYPTLSGTSVVRDFVEFPSQLYEHWLEQPEVLRRFARHHQSGEPIPQDLLERLLASRTFNQGFATVEYVASALYDLEVHSAPPGAPIDPAAEETRILGEIGMPEAMVMRHRPTHFQHVFAGDGYSSAYYSYLWSEVLDADGFKAFREAGDVFDRETAERLRRFVYAAGNLRDPEEAYRAFRGRDPDANALLLKRGLVEA